jgi:hypothetical protein
MSKTLAIMLTATLAVAVAAVTTTMQIQPAYSQTSQCVDRPGFPPGITCITPGKDSVQTTCDNFGSGLFCNKGIPIPPNVAGQTIGQQRQACAQGTATGCTVTQTIPP